MAKKILLFLVAMNFTFGISFAQERQVTGTVKDSKETLIGVSVSVLGTQKGTLTDVNGNYKINVKTGETVVFSYIGFKTQQIKISDQKVLNVSLEMESTLLNEVVAIGYGTIKKKDLTGAVSSINAETIAAAPVSSALEALAGRVSGVTITSTEGSPEAEMTVRVRGGGSLTQDNSPLFIVDGFPVASISDIAPNDIETIDVLKDASSTAIYGSRGANGVIIVTTKSGKAGKTNISFNTFTGVRNLADKLDVLDPYDYVSWQYERSLLKAKPEEYTKYFGTYQDIDLYKESPENDWQEIVFGRTGTTYNQNLSISGGSDKTKYSISHNYVKDKAIMLLSGYERQNLNFKLNHKLYDRLTIDLGVRFADTEINGGGANEVNEKSTADSRLKFAMIYPTIPVADLTEIDEVGDTDAGFGLYQPVVSITDNDQLVKRRQYNLNGAITYEVVKNLKLRSEIGYDDYRNVNDRFYGLTTYYVRNAGVQSNFPILTTMNNNRNTIRNTNTLNYDFKKILPKNHSLNLLLGHEYVLTRESTSSYESRSFPTSFNFEQTRKLTGQGVPTVLNNFYQPNDELLSFFGRANYSYKSKYLFAAALRADGSSKFIGKNKWGYFPSVSAAWRISDESFMETTKNWLNDLKLRASYGEAGNNRILGGLNQEFLVNSEIWINGANSYWAPSNIMANKNLKWETTITRNLGMDLSLFKSKLNVTAEAYLNTTKDLLILYPLSGVGYTYQYRNLGDTENKGLEFSTNYNTYRSKNFDLTINANISFNKNKIKSLGGLAKLEGDLVNTGWASNEISGDFTAAVGGPVGLMYGYVSDGRYEVSDFDSYDGSKWVLKAGVADASSVVGVIRPGTMKLKNLTEGDNVVNASDRRIIGNANPKHTGGISLNSRIYSFDVGAYFNWSYGNDIYNANKIEYTQTSKYHSRNLLSDMAAGVRWTNLKSDGTISNDPAELEAMNANTTMWSPLTSSYVFSDYAVEDGSFLRLATLTLGYTLPKEISKKVKMEKLRVYVSGYNLAKVTNYSGFDPEVSTKRKSPLTPGVDYSAYPRSKTFVLGLNVNF